MKRRILALAIPLATVAASCRDESTDRGPEPAPVAAATNRIALPADVVSNLGVTFREATRGRLEIRLAVPGFLEVPEHRRSIVRAPAAGRLRLSKARWDTVQVGEVVAELSSPELTELEEALSSARTVLLQAEMELSRLDAEADPLASLAEALERAVESAVQRLAAADRLRAHAREHEDAARHRFETLERLSEESTITERELLAARKDLVEAAAAALDADRHHEEAGVRVGELRVQAATTRARVAGQSQQREAAVERRRAAVTAVRQRVRNLALITGRSLDDAGEGGDLVLPSATPDVLSIAAPAPGVIAELHASNGEWVEAGDALAVLLDPTQLVFRGVLPESDLGRLRPGTSVRIEPAGTDQTIDSTLQGPLVVADPRTRTLRVQAPVPNEDGHLPHGVSATAHVLVERGEYDEILVPADCLVQDGLEWICFRRDPADPDQVIRTPVSIGRRSAGWVEVFSGVGESEPLVADGIHQIKETGIGRTPVKGHFHADGTFHAGDE